MSSKRRITATHITVFTRQLAAMVKAGIPLVQAFEVVAAGLASRPMRDMVKRIRDDVAAGDSLADSLRRHPRHFDSLFLSLIEAGELSGTLDIMLERLAAHKERSEALKTKVKKALNYPLAVVLTAVAVTGVLLVKVVPRFAETFDSFGAELPGFTLLVLDLSRLVSAYWWEMPLAAVLAGLAFRRARRRSAAFAGAVDRLALRLPVFGPLLRDVCCARFTRTLATVFGAGVPLVDALDSVAGGVGNRAYAAAVQGIKEDISGGSQLNSAVRASGLFPLMVVQMVGVGEESGTLDAMLERCAVYYEARVNDAVDGLTALLEPAIMVILGALVGGLMVAMYLPIFRLGQVV